MVPIFHFVPVFHELFSRIWRMYPDVIAILKTWIYFPKTSHNGTYFVESILLKLFFRNFFPEFGKHFQNLNSRCWSKVYQWNHFPEKLLPFWRNGFTFQKSQNRTWNIFPSKMEKKSRKFACLKNFTNFEFLKLTFFWNFWKFRIFFREC